MFKKGSYDLNPTYKKPVDSVHLCRSSKKDSSSRYSDYKRMYYLHILSTAMLLTIVLVSYMYILESFLSVEDKDLGKMQDKVYLNPKYPRVLLMGHFSRNNSISAERISKTFPKEDNHDTDKGKRQMFHFNINTVNYKENSEHNAEFNGTTLPSDVEYDDEVPDDTQVPELENGAEIQVVQNLLKNIFGSNSIIRGGKDGHYIIENVIDEKDQAGIYDPRHTKSVNILLDGKMDMQSNSQEKNSGLLKALLLKSSAQKNIKMFHYDNYEANEKNISTEKYQSDF